MNEPTPKPTTKERVLAALRSKGYGHRNPESLFRIASRADCSEGTARKYLRELAAEGLVRERRHSRRDPFWYAVESKEAMS